MEKVYPIDVAGIKNIGIEEWLEDYYIPVTGKEFKNIYDKVFKSYLDIIKQYDNGIIYWIALSDIRIPYYISLYVLELLRFIRLKEKGYEYIIGQKKEKISENISAYKHSYLSNMNLIGNRISGLTPQGRAKNILRTIGYNLSPGHLTNKNFLKNITKPYYFIGNRAQQEVVSFCREKEIAPIHISPMIFAKKSLGKINNDSQYVEMLRFIMIFLNLVRKQHPIIDNSTFELLRKNIEEYFSDSLFFFRQNMRVFSKYKPKNLLVTGLGSQIHRLFCSAWRCAGGRVIGFAHGNSYSHECTPNSFIVLSMVDQYIVSSKGHEEMVKKSEEYFIPDFNMPNTVFLKNNIYKSLFCRLQNSPPVTKIMKIMIIGNIMKNYVALDAEYHTFARLYHQLEIVKLLKDNGYYVIYKPRPETLTEIEGIFETYADEVLTDRLEDVCHYADCLLFSSPYSTTFGFSLLTNKPIVLINVKGYYWYPRAFGLIKKRCSVVEAEAVDGKIVFDKKDVLNAIENSLENIDYEILHEFAF